MNRTRLNTLAAALLLAFATTTAGAQTGGTLDKIRATNTIAIGNRDASLPFTYQVGDGQDPIGFSNDICPKVAEAVRASC